MLDDIVIDTNVLVHAHNREVAYSKEADELARALISPESKTVLKVDPGFHPIEGQNRSRIIGEYLEKLVPGMVAHHMVQELAATGRLKSVEPSKDRSLKDLIRKLVKDPFDRVFLLTASSSSDRTLVSHDDDAFPDEVRSKCDGELSISICDAPEAVAVLAA